MAASFTLNAIAVGLTAVFMVPMIQEMLPKGDPDETTVRIGVGEYWERYKSSADLKGSIPSVRLFDSVGRSVGRRGGSKSKIKEGGFHDVKVKPDDPNIGGRQSEYVSITAHEIDALCIAYISITWPDETKKVWLGNWGMECGGPWYHSNLKVTDDGSFEAKCTWIDRNNSGKIRVQGIGIHITDFGATQARVRQYNEDRSLVCKSKPRFHLYEKLNMDTPIPFFYPPLKFNQDGTDTDVHKVKVYGKIRPLPMKSCDGDRTLCLQENAYNYKTIYDRSIHNESDSTPFMHGRLVTSKRHSAAELCGSTTSTGADFVSHEEGMFCDMSAKQLWPICSAATTHACFDLEKYAMRPGKGLHGRDELSGRPVPHKLYTRTDHW